MLSVVIPSKKERFLARTVKDILEKAEEEVEVIAVLDGFPANPPLPNDSRVKVVEFNEPKGMRTAINAGVEVSEGEYFMKSDAHCAYDKGFDVKLKADLEKDWIAVPVRYSLDPNKWTKRKSPIYFTYIAPPSDQGRYGGVCLVNKYWREKDREKAHKKIPIDDLMVFQGSCYFMHMDYFHELELLDDKNYGTSGKEAIEVCLKCWLSGGRVVRNKKTWYAHLHKGRKWRIMKKPGDEYMKSGQYTMKWFNFKEAWDKQTKPLKWLVDKFGFPEWKDYKWD